MERHWTRRNLIPPATGHVSKVPGCSGSTGGIFLLHFNCISIANYQKKEVFFPCILKLLSKYNVCTLYKDGKSTKLCEMYQELVLLKFWSISYPYTLAFSASSLSSVHADLCCQIYTIHTHTDTHMHKIRVKL